MDKLYDVELIVLHFSILLNWFSKASANPALKTNKPLEPFFVV
ncbi:MAG: hypothetical protein ACM3UY_01415 [Methanocella sp.]